MSEEKDESKQVRTVAANGNIIQCQRLAKGWTVEQLAAKAGLSGKTIEKAESSGKIFVSTLAEIAKALDLDSGLLLNEQDHPAVQGAQTQASRTDYFRLHITLEVPAKPFVEGDALAQFIASLKDLVRPKDSVIPVSVHRGSVIIELSMTPRDIDRLCEAYFQRKLDPLAVVKITFPSASTPNSLGPALAGIAADYIATLLPVHPLVRPVVSLLAKPLFSAWFKSKSGDTPNTTESKPRDETSEE